MNCQKCNSENIITYLLPVKPFEIGRCNLDTAVECLECKAFYQLKELIMQVPSV